jgi:hypothetical protein
MKIAILLLWAYVALVAESAAGLKWTTPSGWIPEGSSAMRAVTYRVPPAPGSERLECAVYFFGPGQGGSVEANLDRWKSQFTLNGKPAAGKVEKRKIHNIPVTTLDISGTYMASGGMATGAEKPQGDFRMLAAVAEGPGGNIFIRLIGPAKSMNENQAKFEQLLASIQKE